MKKLILADPNGALCQAWQQAFASYPAVEIRNCRFEEVPGFDCMPGLGTATGRMPVEEAARQMALAYQFHLSPPQTIT